MKPTVQYEQAITSGDIRTEEASIMMTDQMFNLLSNAIYTDKILAVIREPLCNARDAQVEAGNSDQPIKVHLPNMLEPYLYIRDYGKGLSEKQAMKLYMKYGFSTKQDTNDLIGGMGIGSKSPLAYQDSFLVMSYQNGIVKTFSVYKDSGKPKISKMSEEATDEPDGLRVQVPVKKSDMDTFCVKLGKFAAFFDHPLDVVGNSAWTRFKRNVIVESEKYNLYETRGWSERGEVAAVMGGVTYSISRELTHKFSTIKKMNEHFMVLKFEIGDLSIAPSREALSEDEETVKKITSRVDEVFKDYYDDIRKEVESAKTYREGLQKAVNGGVVKQTISGYTSSTITKIKDLLLDDFNKKFFNVNLSYVMPSSRSKETIRLTNLSFEDKLIMIVDMSTGFLKASKALAREKGRTVIFVTPEVLAKIKEYTDIDDKNIYKCSEHYDRLCPKSTTVSVARSGVFDHKGNEIRSLTENSEGYYIPFTRSEMDTTHCPCIGSWESIQDIIRELKALGRLKEDIYFVRKGGMPAIKKTKIIPLTKGILSKQFDGLFNKKMLRKNWLCNTHISEKLGWEVSRYSEALWDIVKDYYPLSKELFEQEHKNDSVPEYYLYTILSENFFDTFDIKIPADTNFAALANAEKRDFSSKIPILSKLSYWQVDEGSDIEKDLILLAKTKFKKQKKGAVTCKK